ncbi:ABC transporter ATP-binding protein [Salinirubellus salinus]
MAVSSDESVFDRYRADVERPMRRLARTYGTPRKEWFVVGLLGNLVAQFASLAPPVVLGAAIDGVLRGGTFSLPLVPAGWIPTGTDGQFLFAVGVIGGAFVLTALATWVYGVAANEFAHGVMHDVRVDCFEKMQALDMAFFDDKQTGEVMSILSSDTENLEMFLDNALTNSVRLGAMVLGIAGILLYLNPVLAAVTLIIVPGMLVFTVWFMRVAEPRYARRRASVGNLNTRLENAISGVELTKTTASEPYETGRVRDASYRLFEDTMSMLRLAYFYRPGMELLAGVAFVATFGVGGYWLVYGPPLGVGRELEIGTFVTFVFLTQRFVTPLAEVSNIVDQYENAKASSERVFGLMDIPARVRSSEDAVDLTDPEGRVVYDDVSFAYDGIPGRADGAEGRGEETVVRDVSTRAEPGETVGVVGPTGAGKSTLLKLLLRLYDVDEGAITLDGHDVRDVSIESLRDAVGYVGQDTFLFDGTIAENIEYGRFGASDEAVREAARAAEAHEFITQLPDGYETRVGERGVKLSGGQRQRIAIARVVLQDPAVLVLDEATSAVDTKTEYLIQKSLDALSEDRTAFVIAHRLSTVKDADGIVVLDDGEIVERGTHEELLDQDGLYAGLWAVQAGDAERLSGEFGSQIAQD